MAMGSKLGREEAGIEASIDRDFGTDSGCTGFTLAMFMLGSGLMGRVMAVEFIHAKMGAVMLGSSSGVLNTGLVTTISEMGTHTLENILLTRCTALGFINLPMGTATRGPGMRVEGKGLECTHSETVRHNLVTGKMEFLTFQAHKIQRTLYLLLLSIIPKYSMQCRKQDEQQRRLMMWRRSMKGSTEL